MIVIDKLCCSYDRGRTPALRDVSITFPREKTFAVLGESGSGKTTLLNCIARFIRPDSGSISIEGRDLATMPETELRRTLGVVFQRLNLFPHLSVRDNMTLAPVRALGQDPAETAAQADEMLDRLGIADLAERYPAQISGGQAQRVAIARGLMLQPQYMLLDEPTSALDARTTAEFAAWLNELRADTSMIIVTHDLPFAAEAATHGVFLANGQVAATGEVNAIITRAQETQPT